jgi:hypothetical protein
MSVIITVIAAFAAVVAIGRWQGQSATALGRVSAVLSVTAAFAEAWKKTNEISRRWASDPTIVSLPSVVAAPVHSSSLARREPEENDFYSENPSFRTGGIRGYSAYEPFDRR